jgi:hypothetical protein
VLSIWNQKWFLQHGWSKNPGTLDYGKKEKVNERVRFNYWQGRHFLRHIRSTAWAHPPFYPMGTGWVGAFAGLWNWSHFMHTALSSLSLHAFTALHINSFTFTQNETPQFINFLWHDLNWSPRTILFFIIYTRIYKVTHYFSTWVSEALRIQNRWKCMCNIQAISI